MATKKPSSKTKPKETPKRGRGRPRKVIPVASIELQVERFASVGCTQQEIATLLGIGKATLERHYGPTYEKGLANLKQSLRRKQVDLAKAGNVTMLIWLGKNLLEQRDRSELTGRDGSALVPGSIIFTMPKNGRDQGSAEAKTPAQPPVSPVPKTPPGESPSTEPAVPEPAAAPSAAIAPAAPPAPPSLTPAQIAGTAEVDEDRPRPRYSHGGRDPRVAENIHSLKPIGPAGGPGARTGKR
jgi:hypothetical protein